MQRRTTNIFPNTGRIAVGILAVLMAFAMITTASAGIMIQDMNSGLTPQDLVTKIVGEGVSVSNVNFSCANRAAGIFDEGDATGIHSGLVFGTGDINLLPGPNTNTYVSNVNGFLGDDDLNKLNPNYYTQDACVLEFDFVPIGNEMSIHHVFSSEEYNYYVNTAFNDIFAFFVNGKNIALIPGTNIPISINNVNGGNPFGTGGNHSEYFRNNELSSGGGAINISMNGLTTVFTASTEVNPGQTNHIKLAIADAGDSILDSNVFIEAESIISYNKGSATGVKFNDLNENAVNDNEPVLSNWTIVLTNVETGVVVQTTTNETGQYVFSDLVIGTYLVEEVSQNGWNQTYPTAGNYTITITKQGENLTGLDFGNYKVVPKLGSAAGMKFNDTNKNGVIDENETGLEGWTIVLSNETDVINTNVTNETGQYFFEDLAPGNYTIKEEQQTGWFQTAPAGSYTFTVTESEKFTDLNFGNVYDIPSAACIPGVNPAGRMPPSYGGDAQRPNGFYQIVGTGLLPYKMFIKDIESGTIFGPYQSGTYIKYTQNNAKPGAKEMPGPIQHINGNGDFVVYSTNNAGTSSPETVCLVPKPPK